MEEARYMISEAAKQIDVEAHVLRYWEKELALPISAMKWTSVIIRNRILNY